MYFASLASRDRLLNVFFFFFKELGRAYLKEKLLSHVWDVNQHGIQNKIRFDDGLKINFFQSRYVTFH